MKESVQKRKRSHDDGPRADYYAILHPLTIENSLLQVNTRELYEEENRVIAVAYLQRINWARSAAILLFSFFSVLRYKQTRFVQTALTNERATRIDRLEDPPPLLFFPQDRLAQNSPPQSALKSCVVHKLRQKYTTFNMMRQSMICNISDNVDCRKKKCFF